MKVVTVNSDLANRVFNDFLKASCEFYKMDAIVLEYDDVFFSNRIKDLLLNSYLGDVSDDEIIFFTDATDAVFVTNEQEILKKFKQFNAPLVFSAEINCWPDKALEVNYPAPSSVHFRYLNCGGFIANVGYLKYLYQKYPAFENPENMKFIWSNQYYWNTVYKLESNDIKIDHNCEIFYNTSIPIVDRDTHIQELKDPGTVNKIVHEEKRRLDKEITFTNGRIKSNITNSFPCHIHFPGIVSKKLVNSGYFNDIKPPVIVV